MLIGCPKEIKNQEYRVGLTPSNAADYNCMVIKLLLKKVQEKDLDLAMKNIKKLVLK
ncbi:hypothetical protein [Brachyspira murdochii]|uniref:hypothetical protein n=1 Tax=Brachyspira murdochii TaxID=84378 RepID=UPI001E648B70|nr:hypothetical protein [Brachyspira murdochii]